jgi:hypothetical protein
MLAPRPAQKNIYLRAVDIWIVLVVSSFLVGNLRAYLLFSLLGDYASHLVSVCLQTAIVITASFFLVKQYGSDHSPKIFFYIGLGWMLATFFSDFIIAHFILRTPWQIILPDYNIVAGRIWELVLLAELLSPVVLRSILIKKISGPDDEQ